MSKTLEAAEAPPISWGQFRKNEQERFGLEVLSHIDTLYRVASYLARNEHDAKDYVQETCARALASKHQFTQGTNLKAWLTRILYNFYFDSYARNRRVQVTDVTDPTDGFWDDLLEDSPGLEERLMQLELARKISDALNKIPNQFREAVVLVDNSDFSYQEAAETLACPIGTIRSRLSRGRKLLAHFLKGYATARSRPAYDH